MGIQDEGVAGEVRELTRRLEALRLAYERYFAGVDKMQPAVERRKVGDEINRLSRAAITNTQVRFQLAQAKGRFLTLQTLWNRVLDEMERGVYSRDRFRMSLRDKRAGPDETAAESTPAGAAAKTAPPADAKRVEVEADMVDKIHRAYLYAKQKCNEPVDGITRDRIAASLAKQLERMRAEQAGPDPEFKVVIKDGKARIVARKR